MPGIEVSTDGSSPREMVVVDGNVYLLNGILLMLKFLIYHYTLMLQSLWVQCQREC